MKKWLFLLGCSLLLCGCTQSNIVSKGGELAPDLETRADIEMNWEQGFEDLSSEILVNEQVVNMGYLVSEAEENEFETVYLTVIVDSAMQPEEAAELGTQVVKLLGDSMCDQDFSLTKSSADSYGSVFEKFNVCLRVIAEDKMEDESVALVNDMIMAGEDYRPINANR